MTQADAGVAPSMCRCSHGGETYAKLGALVEYLDSLRGRADLGVLTTLLQGLDVGRRDIAPSCLFGQKGYKRNTIRKTEWYELLALCWRSGDRTPIHDHKGVSCAFRVVEGVGTEIRFAPTPSGLICPVETIEMRPGYVCAAADADIHEVANMQAPGEDLITLHIYSPPIKRMNVYEFTQPVPDTCREQYADATDDMPC
ncbi:MAG: cysteine dioxygenase family protein [Planctomycetota bacterium]|nr:cysteine dioxygenase family protein [Planctomycetota bacterium]